MKTELRPSGLRPTGPSSLTICEVAPRDGLQSESCQLTVEDKLLLIRGLAEAGAKQIEIGSFVSPKAVPAMANTDEVCTRLQDEPLPGVQTLGLIMNEKGLERALKAKVGGVCIVTVVSNTLCLKNNNCQAFEATKRVVHLVHAAKSMGLFTRVDIATAWACPYEGKIEEAAVLEHAEQVFAAAPDEVALCDSIGHADPLAVHERFLRISELFGIERLVAHLHDTLGLGLANATAALLAGVRRFDTAIGGLGGCPFARGARGNLATEDLLQLATVAKLDTGYNLEAVYRLRHALEPIVGRPLGRASTTDLPTALSPTTTTGGQAHA